MKNEHFRELDSRRYAEGVLPAEFREFVTEEIWPRLEALHEGYKQAAKKKTAAHVAHALITTGLTGRVVADSRDTAEPGVSLRVQVWDAFIAARLCRLCRGSESSGRVTRYRATRRLLKLRQLWELRLLEDIRLRRNSAGGHPTAHALVVIHSGRYDQFTGRTLSDEDARQPMDIREYLRRQCPTDPADRSQPDPEAMENGMDFFRSVEDDINQINTENLRHSWIAFGPTGIAFQPNVCLRQIHAGRAFRAVRLYSWGAISAQGLSKEIRRTIRIDDEPAAEIDSSCHAIRMCYHFAHIDADGDVYHPEKVFPAFYAQPNAEADARAIVRGFVKTATNICLNVEERDRATAAISQALREHPERPFLNDLIFGREDGRVGGMIDRLVAAHPPRVGERFFSDFGLELMTVDGNIMKHTLLDLVVDQEKPALGIHDSLIVRASDHEHAALAFSRAYAEFMGFLPTLKRVF